MHAMSTRLLLNTLHDIMHLLVNNVLCTCWQDICQLSCFYNTGLKILPRCMCGWKSGACVGEKGRTRTCIFDGKKTAVLAKYYRILFYH